MSHQQPTAKRKLSPTSHQAPLPPTKHTKTGAPMPTAPTPTAPTPPTLALPSTVGSNQPSAFTPAPAPSTSGGPSWFTPQRTELSSVGKSTHFSGVKLPKRVTRKETAQGYDGDSEAEDRFKAILKHKSARRGDLPEKLTRTKREEARDKREQEMPMTLEEREMADDSEPSLSEVGAQRNHVVAAETGVVGFSGGVSQLRGASRPEARRRSLQMVKALTGSDPKALAKAEELLDEHDSDADTSDDAELVGTLARFADHPHNVDLGHGGKNMTMSNRPDVTTSPRRTHMIGKDAEILTGMDSPMRSLIGEDLTDRLLSVPMSPGGTHIMSSKRLESDSSGSDSESESSD